MSDITTPDFNEWAKRAGVDLSTALQTAFEQGRALGQREGKKKADEEWWSEQDKALQEWTHSSDEETNELLETASLQDYIKFEKEDF